MHISVAGYTSNSRAKHTELFFLWPRLPKIFQKFSVTINLLLTSTWSARYLPPRLEQEPLHHLQIAAIQHHLQITAIEQLISRDGPKITWKAVSQSAFEPSRFTSFHLMRFNLQGKKPRKTPTDEADGVNDETTGTSLPARCSVLVHLNHSTEVYRSELLDC